MKSIIEQASSIIKAIEKAWNQAEKPTEFSIKVFEQEEKNFFGMATKPAKIGIFFGDKPVVHEKPTFKPRQEIKECRSSFTPPSHKATEERGKNSQDRTEPYRKAGDKQPSPQPQKTQPIRAEQSKSTPHTKPAPQRTPEKQADKVQTTTSQTEKAPFAAPSHKDTQERNKPAEEKIQRIPAAWNDTMIATTHNWLKKTLSLMGLPTIDFSSEITGKNLKLTFNAPLVADPMHEKQLFRSFAHLIMSSLRNQYKQEIKDLKVILIRPE